MDGDGRMVSPGTLDMAGLVVTPREQDFLEISADEACAMLKEVAMSEETFEIVSEKVRE